jgi:hypothetical protein
MNRYEVIKVEAADYLMIGIVDNNINKVICHMNTFTDIDPAELEDLANTIVDHLNKQ